MDRSLKYFFPMPGLPAATADRAAAGFIVLKRAVRVLVGRPSERVWALASPGLVATGVSLCCAHHEHVRCARVRNTDFAAVELAEREAGLVRQHVTLRASDRSPEVTSDQPASVSSDRSAKNHSIELVLI